MMKKTLFLPLFLKPLLTLFVLCSLLSALCLGQWQPDVRLTNDTAASYTSANNAWCIASNGSVVHVVWQDARDGNREIYYKRSTDSGITWGADTRLTNNFFLSFYPSVAVSGSVVHVVWYDDREGITNTEIYYKRSTDGGSSWEADTRLTNAPNHSFTPSVAVSGQVVHVVWEDNRDGNPELYFKRSTDGGINWGTDIRLTFAVGNSFNPSIAVSGSVVHVVWHDIRDGNNEIYYKRSTDGGTSWGADVRMTNNSAISQYSCVAVSGSVVHVVWYDGRDGNNEIYYKRSTDGGVSWGADTRLTNDPAYSEYSSITVSGSIVHVAWYDGRDGNSEIYYKRSTDAGSNWGTDTRLTNNSASSFSPSVAVSGSVVHVVWYDQRDGNREIYYKRDPTGNPVGIIELSNEIPNQFMLSQNYPNPFNPSTNILFDIPLSSHVKLTLYDALGRELMELANDELKPGSYRYDFNAENLPSGVYFYRLSAGDYVATRKMVLIK